MDVQKPSENPKLIRLCDSIFEKVEDKKYFCIHGLLADMLRLVHGDEIFVVGEDGKIRCHVKERHVESTEKYIMKDIKIWEEKIQWEWLNWKMQKVMINNEEKKFFIAPILFKTMLSNMYDRHLLVIVWPRLLTEDFVPNGDMRKKIPRLDRLLGLIRYWFAKDIHELKVVRENLYRILMGKKISNSNKQSLTEELIKTRFLWPVGFQDLIDALHVIWRVYSEEENINAWEESNKEEIEKLREEYLKSINKEEDEGGCEDINRYFWVWLEKQIEKNLCVSKLTCPNNRKLLCPESERDDKKRYLQLCKLLKWRLANYKDGKLLPFEPDENDFQQVVDLHESLYDELKTLVSLG